MGWVLLQDGQRRIQENEIIKNIDETEKHIDLITEGSIGVFMWADNHNKCLDPFLRRKF